MLGKRSEGAGVRERERRDVQEPHNKTGARELKECLYIMCVPIILLNE